MGKYIKHILNKGAKIYQKYCKNGAKRSEILCIIGQYILQIIGIKELVVKSIKLKRGQNNVLRRVWKRNKKGGAILPWM